MVSADTLRGIRDPAPQRMRSSSIDVAGVVILRLRGEVDIAEVSAFRQAFGDALTATDELLVLDLEKVTFMDLAAMAAVIDAVRQADRAGCVVSIVSAGPRVRKVFEMTGNETLLEPPSSLVDVEIALSIERSERAGGHDG